MSGPLISADFAERLLASRFRGRLGETERGRAAARLLRWWQGVDASCGPASSVRQLVESAARPLALELGFAVARVDPDPAELWTLALTCRDAIVPLVVIPWAASPEPAWRRIVRRGLLHRAAWCLVFNGRTVRLVDAGRAYARRHLEFDLPTALEHPRSFETFWSVLRAEAFAADAGGEPDLVTAIARASDEEGTRVCVALRGGVRRGIEHLLGALVHDQRKRRAPAPLERLHVEALTAVYRLLFLLFAEARRLVPVWHPLYRAAYSVDALRQAAVRDTSAPGLWQALQAIGRLAHAGCRADDLEVTAFNGRLFSPARAPRLDRARLDDGAVRDALLAVSTVEGTRGEPRQRIAFGDLGVEELGAVYEGLLEYEPVRLPPLQDAAAARARGGRPPSAEARAEAVRLERTGAARRKATGTFYTPASLTRFLVRQTLDPLIEGRTPGQLLELRVCDPAMGSGAFLVAACRHLARAYEAALVAEGACSAADLDAPDRAAFRRLVAQRCLFGVDLNPMAVQLARLSLWLTTLAAGHPLTFLDHHLTAGDSLLGAGPADLLRTPPRPRGGAGSRQLPLFDPAELEALITLVFPVRRQLEETEDATAAVVHAKESALAGLEAREDLARWREACDIWCANWCRGRPAPPATLRALLDHALHGASPLPPRVLAAERETAADFARRLRFLHWPLAFPEVFFDRAGAPRTGAGFDAVIGNPPWEMLRADTGGARGRDEGRAAVRFASRSGLYAAREAGHANQYQLFVERALDLTRAGGRVGLIVPGGLALDAGAAPLRRRLFQRCDVDVIIGFENRAGVFPIHRSTRFLLVTATRGGRTAATRCRFGLHDPAALEPPGDGAPRGGSDPAWVTLSPALLERLGGSGLPVPHVTSARDLRIAETITAVHPRLEDERGWGARFGRELNATDHRAHFSAGAHGLPVLEGKHVSPFRVRADQAAWRIDPERAAALLPGERSFLRPRVAFRDVASATNRQTVIAAIVPAGCLTTHTLFCLRTRLTLADQRVLCAMLNSYPLNFLVRQRISTHVSLAVIRTIPVPRPPADAPLHTALERAVRRLEAGRGDTAAAATELQGLAAVAFGLAPEDYAHILSTFPLVPEADRRRAFEAFTRLRRREG